VVPWAVDVGGKKVYTLDAGNWHAVVALCCCAVLLNVRPVWKNLTFPRSPATVREVRTFEELNEEPANPPGFEDEEDLFCVAKIM
jgi:hypothetical protein